MIFLCSRDWLFQAQAGATHLGVAAFCNRFAPLEGNLVEEEDDEEEKVALVPSAAKEARWRKWRPHTCARTSQSSRGADELFDWDTLSLAPVGAAASPSVSYPRIANTDTCMCVCVCVWLRACSSGSPFAVVASAPSPPLTKPTPWWYAAHPPTSSSASRFHFLTPSNKPLTSPPLVSWCPQVVLGVLALLLTVRAIAESVKVAAMAMVVKWGVRSMLVKIGSMLILKKLAAIALLLKYGVMVMGVKHGLIAEALKMCAAVMGIKMAAVAVLMNVTKAAFHSMAVARPPNHSPPRLDQSPTEGVCLIAPISRLH